MREHLHTTGDMPSPIADVIKEFKETLPNLDTFLTDERDLWFMEHLNYI